MYLSGSSPFLHDIVYQNCSECKNNTKITICVHNMFCRYSELTIFMNNEQSFVILWVSWCKNKSFWQNLPVPEKEASKNETKKFWIIQCLFQEKSLIFLHTTHFYCCIVTLVVLRTIGFKSVVYLIFLEELGTKKVIQAEFSQIE